MAAAVSHCGELGQCNTSAHDWLNARGGPVQHRMRMIDDATGRSADAEQPNTKHATRAPMRIDQA